MLLLGRSFKNQHEVYWISFTTAAINGNVPDRDSTNLGFQMKIIWNKTSGDEQRT